MTIKKILVPTDLSWCSKAAVERAAELARITGASLTLIHVIEDMTYEWMYQEVAIPAHIMAEREEEARQRMEAQLSAKQALGIHLDTQAIQGVAYEAIVEFAANKDIDLVVMGTHGRRGLSHLFLGSVAERVVQLAPCPVMTVKSSEPEPDAAEEAEAIAAT